MITERWRERQQEKSRPGFSSERVDGNDRGYAAQPPDAGQLGALPLHSLATRLARHTETLRCACWVIRRRVHATLSRLGRSWSALLSGGPVPRGGQEADARCLVVVGDSLGAGFGEPVCGLEVVGWAERIALAAACCQQAMQVINLAKKGLTTEQIAQSQLAAATALCPDVIVLAAGGNDLLARDWSPARFAANYAGLLGSLQSTGAIVLTTTWHNVPLAVAMPPLLARRFSRRLEAASDVVREVSQRLGAPCVDFWALPALLDSGCYSSDGIHPNARGYLRVAEILADALEEHAGLALSRTGLSTAGEQQDGSAASPATPSTASRVRRLWMRGLAAWHGVALYPAWLAQRCAP